MAKRRNIRARVSVEDRASKTFKTISTGIHALGAAAVAVGAFQIGRKLVGGLQSAVAASLQYESAAVRLAVALRNQGEFTAAGHRSLLDYARALTDASNATENQIIGAIASAKAMGASDEAAKKLTRAATDLAVATGVDVDTAFRQVNKTLGGYAGELGEVVPELKDLTQEQLRAGDAADVLLAKFQGAGEAGAKTLEGGVNNLNSAFDQLKTTVGGPVRSVLTDLVNVVLVPTVKDMNAAANESNGWRDAIYDVAIAGAELAAVLADLGSEAVVWYQMAKAAPGPLGTLADGFSRLTGLVDLNVAATSKYGKRFKEWADQMRAAKAAGDPLAATIEEIGNSSSTTAGAIAGVRDEIAGLVIDWEEASRIFYSDEQFAAMREQAVGMLEPIGGMAQGLKQVGDTWTGIEGSWEAGKKQLDDLRKEGKTTVAATTEQAVAIGGALSGVGDSMAGLFGRSKAVAIAQALVNVGEGATKAIAQGGFLGIAMMVSVIAAGMAQVATMRSRTPSGYQSGGIVPGLDSGVDSTLIMARPGEAVLPKELTEFLLSAAGGGGKEKIEVHLHGSIAALGDLLTVSVRRGTTTLEATRLAGARSVR